MEVEVEEAEVVEVAEEEVSSQGGIPWGIPKSLSHVEEQRWKGIHPLSIMRTKKTSKDGSVESSTGLC